MLPVKKIDISWRDLAYGFWKTLFPKSKKQVSFKGVPCYTVRTGFDRLFSILNLPKESEILMTAATIVSMEKIVRYHDLIPVPIDLNQEHFHPDIEEIKSKITSKTKMIVVAHLFGNYTDIKPIIELAKIHNLLVVEDCAQYPGFWDHDEPLSDVMMFSFGPAKAYTALGGALFKIKDKKLVQEFEHSLAKLPKQSKSEFIKRLIRYSFIKLLGTKTFYTIIYKICHLINYPLQERLGRSSVFGKKDFYKEIHKKPSLAMIHLLARRLSICPLSTLTQRKNFGHYLSGQIPKKYQIGTLATKRYHLVFPLVVENKKLWIESLQKNGFDCAEHDNLIIVGKFTEKADLKKAPTILSNLIYIPFYPQLKQKNLEELGKCLSRLSNKACHS